MFNPQTVNESRQFSVGKSTLRKMSAFLSIQQLFVSFCDNR